MERKIIFNNYIKGKLDKAAKFKLEQKLEKDNSFAQEFQKYKIEKFLKNELPVELARELERELQTSKRLKRLINKVAIELYLKDELNEESELYFESELEKNKELKEEYDFYRIEKYINEELPDRHLIELELDLDNDAELAQKLEFSEEIESIFTANENGFSNPFDKVSINMNNEEEFMKAMDKAIEEFKREQATKTPKQQNLEKLDTLKNLQKIENETTVDHTNLGEVEIHKNILDGIEKELEKIKTENFFKDIELGDYYSPHLKRRLPKKQYSPVVYKETIGNVEHATDLQWVFKSSNIYIAAFILKTYSSIVRYINSIFRK